ncbi:MAG: 3'-5' exonuclease [Pseudomonadota bacterium]
MTDSDLLSKLAREDLAASKRTLGLVASEMEDLRRELLSDGSIPEKSQKIKNLNALATTPFTIRCDYLDVDSDRENTCYLTTANRSLIVDGLKIASWTTHLASHLRQLDVGEDSEFKLAGRDTCITLILRGDYGESQPDVADVRYKNPAGNLYLKSALELLEQPIPARPKRKEGRDFGLRQLVLETDPYQDKTMRYPMKGFLRIEGVPGSGKTTVALQRIAYVIAEQYEEFGFNEGDAVPFSQKSTLVIVLNEILEVYLRRLLEELSLEDVIVLNFNDFLRDTFFRPRGLLNDILPIPRSQSFPWLELVKTRFEILSYLNRFMCRHALNELKPISRTLIPKFKKALPTRYKGLGLLFEDALAGLEKTVEEHKLQLKTFIHSLEQIESKVPKGGKTRNAWQGTLAELSAQLIHIFEPVKILVAFAESREFDNYLNDAESRGVIKKHHRLQIKSKWQEMLSADMITENDLALAALVHAMLIQGINRETSLDLFKTWLSPLPIYSHLVLDEIQDLTEIQTRFLYHHISQDMKCITAVGDLTQRLKWPEGIESWDRTGLFAQGQDVVHCVFKINYRQTYELGKLAYEFHSRVFGSDPLFVPSERSRGPKPTLTVVKNVEREIKKVIELVPQVVGRLQNPTIALVIEDAASVEGYYNALKQPLSPVIECCLSTGRHLRRLEVLHLVLLDDIKGLEFDAVIISDVNKILHSPKTESAVMTAKNRLYVAITRARKELHCFAHRSIPEALWKVRMELQFQNRFTCPRCGASNGIEEAKSAASEKVTCLKCKTSFSPPFTKDEVPVSAG